LIGDKQRRSCSHRRATIGAEADAAPARTFCQLIKDDWRAEKSACAISAGTPRRMDRPPKRSLNGRGRCIDV
jgi:hypothetical protein